MSNNPRPEDDEKWTVDEELEETNDYEENQEQEEINDEDNGSGYFSRRQTLGIGAAALGLAGGVVGTAYWNGGDVQNTSASNNTTNTTHGLEGGGTNVEDPDLDLPDTTTDEPEDTTTPEDETTDEEISQEGNVYELEDGVTVDLDSLDSIFEYSGVDMGVQENGNLVAWNQHVEVEGEDGSTFSPLYRFRSDLFPDRDLYEIDGNHPIEEIYSELEEELEEMSEGMVKVFYDEDRDEGEWEDHREFKRIEYDELKEGLLEHSGLGPAQDYFFNRLETMRTREAELEEEWEDLLKDGLEAN